jgi:hypothetical protein
VLRHSISSECCSLLGCRSSIDECFVGSLIGSTRVLSLWDRFSTHPVTLRLGESEIVNNAISDNMHRLRQEGSPSRAASTMQHPQTIEGLIAVHIRRGDFRGIEGWNNGHCAEMSKWGSTYSGSSILILPLLGLTQITKPRMESTFTIARHLGAPTKGRSGMGSKHACNRRPLQQTLPSDHDASCLPTRVNSYQQ